MGVTAFPRKIHSPYHVAVFFIWFCAAPLLPAQDQDSWNSCSTPKTQYVLQVPASLIHSTAPAATGCAFQTNDGEFNVEAVVQAVSSREETLEQRMQKEMELLAH